MLLSVNRLFSFLALACILLFLLGVSLWICTVRSLSRGLLLDSARKPQTRGSQQKLYSTKPALEALELVLHANKSEIDNEIIPTIPFAFPRPAGQDTVDIYNTSAWKMLREILTTRTSLTICANGGSVTAGGGARGGRYYTDFINYMNMTGVTLPGAHIDIVERGHGTRGSLHSALMSHSYFPPGIDILVWEFSMNDDSRQYTRIKDPEHHPVEERNVFLSWLDAVSEIQPHPPLVILSYLWSSPFRMANGITEDQVFTSHQRLGAKYDFVVGHVNFGSYLEELQWGEELTKEALLYDQHHPNRLGHALLGHVLLDFITPDKERLVRATQRAPSLLGAVKNVTIDWGCGTESKEKRLMKQIVARAKTSVADWTMEYPKNANNSPGMLSPSNSTYVKTLGREDPSRKDRQSSLGLPCCHDGSPKLEFVPHDRGTMALQGIHLGVPEKQRGQVSVFLDAQDVTGRQIKIGSWECLWNFKHIYGNLHWVALESEQHASRIRLCSNDVKTCGSEENGVLIQSLSVY